MSNGGHNGDGLLLGSALGGMLERLANAALALDAVSNARLAALHGKVLRVRCTSPPLASDLHFTRDGLRLRGVPDDQAALPFADAGVDTLLSGPASAFLGLLMEPTDNPAEALLGSGLEVAGDSGLAAELAGIASHLEPDLETPLTPLVGQRNAMLLGTAAKGLADALRGLAGGARRQADAALQRASAQALADPAAVQRFLDEVDDLAAATDRLEARLQRLAQARP